jgi:hypothetical protein
MIIDLTGDYYADAGIEELLSFLYSSLGSYFKRKKYSENEPKIFMVVNCQPKELRLRRRYLKKENALYYDIILDYQEIKKSVKGRKKEIIAVAIVDSLEWLKKYDFGVDVEKLKIDMKAFFKKHEWL